MTSLVVRPIAAALIATLLATIERRREIWR
jgi:hypothetical protein